MTWVLLRWIHEDGSAVKPFHWHGAPHIPGQLAQIAAKHLHVPAVSVPQVRCDMHLSIFGEEMGNAPVKFHVIEESS